MESSLRVPERVINRITICPSNSTTHRFITPQIKNRYSDKHLSMNVHTKTIYRGQKVETTQMPINRLMGKKLVV